MRTFFAYYLACLAFPTSALAGPVDRSSAGQQNQVVVVKDIQPVVYVCNGTSSTSTQTRYRTITESYFPVSCVTQIPKPTVITFVYTSCITYTTRIGAGQRSTITETKTITQLITVDPRPSSVSVSQSGGAPAASKEQGLPNPTLGVAATTSSNSLARPTEPDVAKSEASPSAPNEPEETRRLLPESPEDNLFVSSIEEAFQSSTGPSLITSNPALTASVPLGPLPTLSAQSIPELGPDPSRASSSDSVISSQLTLTLAPHVPSSSASTSTSANGTSALEPEAVTFSTITIPLSTAAGFTSAPDFETPTFSTAIPSISTLSNPPSASDLESATPGPVPTVTIEGELVTDTTVPVESTLTSPDPNLVTSSPELTTTTEGELEADTTVLIESTFSSSEPELVTSSPEPTATREHITSTPDISTSSDVPSIADRERYVTVTAAGNLGTSSTVTAPAGATAMSFFVQGGCGGGVPQLDSFQQVPGGRSAILNGTVPVRPGQQIAALAGGSGDRMLGGTGGYGDGGGPSSPTGGWFGWGGGAGSAVLVDGELLVVSPGGGGSGAAASTTAITSEDGYRGDADPAGSRGQGLIAEFWIPGQFMEAGGGRGSPTDSSEPGAGGVSLLPPQPEDSVWHEAVNGNPGNGINGGDMMCMAAFCAGGGGGGYAGGGGGGQALSRSPESTNGGDRALFSGGAAGSMYRGPENLHVQVKTDSEVECVPGSVVLEFF